MANYIIRGIAGNKKIRCFVAVTTELVEKARKIHNTSPVASAALGRALTAGSIMGYMLKGEKDKLTLQIKGSNYIKNIVVVSDTKGNVKGYISHPHIDLPLNDKGKLDVGGAIGKDGSLIIIKDLGLKEPYIGQSNLVTGEIGDDIAAYYMYSEQQPSIVSLGVLVDVDTSIKAAGGFIIQPLPDVDENTLIKLEEAFKDVKPISSMIDSGMSGEDILKEILKDFDVEIIEKKEVDFVCDCSIDKFERALISIGKEELSRIIEEDEKAEIVCHFCKNKYNFNKEELNRLLIAASEEDK